MFFFKKKPLFERPDYMRNNFDYDTYWFTVEKSRTPEELIELLERIYSFSDWHNRIAGTFLLRIFDPALIGEEPLLEKEPEKYYDHARAVAWLEKMACQDGRVDRKKQYTIRAYQLFSDGPEADPKKAQLYLEKLAIDWRDTNYIQLMYKKAKELPLNEAQARRVYPVCYDQINMFGKKEQENILAHLAIYITQQDEIVMDYMVRRGTRLKKERDSTYELRCEMQAVHELAAEFRDEWNDNHNLSRIQHKQYEYSSRDSYVQKHMGDYRSELDSRERAVNSLVSRQFKTNDEMNMTGEMSQSDYFGWDVLRSEAEDKKRRELENEYAERTKPEENPFADMAGNYKKGVSDIDIFEKGIDLEQAGKLEEAFKLYELAASMGNVRAIYWTGYAYEEALGVAQNYQKAMEYYRAAMRRNDERAMFQIGNLYINGNGVDKDYAAAKKYYFLAAFNGDSTALHNLGYMNENGFGFPKNVEKALYWYRKGAEADVELSQKSIVRLTQKSSEDQSN